MLFCVAIIFCWFRLPVASAICPWVSEDEFDFFLLFFCVANKDKFPYGWTYERGHRSDVFMHFQTPEKNNTQTLVELIREISLSYTPVIEADISTYMYDVRKWLEECTVPKLSGHIHQHQFKLVKGPDGKALLFYKTQRGSKTSCPGQKYHELHQDGSGPSQILP